MTAGAWWQVEPDPCPHGVHGDNVSLAACAAARFGTTPETFMERIRDLLYGSTDPNRVGQIRTCTCGCGMRFRARRADAQYADGSCRSETSRARRNSR